MILRFEARPKYTEAHPDDDTQHDEPCHECAWATNPLTGERYLLWRSNGVHWSLSRHDPRYGTGERIEDIELIGEPTDKEEAWAA